MNKLYVHKCDVRKMTGDRLETQKTYLKIINDMKHLQISKYLNTVMYLILNNEIKEAIHKTELMVEYMDKIHFNSIHILDVIYQSFGVRLCLSFQYLDRWNEEKNYKRMLILFGIRNNLSSYLFDESFFGPNYSNPKYE